MDNNQKSEIQSVDYSIFSQQVQYDYGDHTPSLLDVIKNDPKLATKVAELENMGQGYWSFMYFVKQLLNAKFEFPITVTGSIVLRTFGVLNRTYFHDVDFLVDTVSDKEDLVSFLLESRAEFNVAGYDEGSHHAMLEIYLSNDFKINMCIFVSQDVKIHVVDNLYISEPYSVFAAKAKYNNPEHKQKYLNDVGYFSHTKYNRYCSLFLVGKIYKHFYDKTIAKKFKKYLFGEF